MEIQPIQYNYDVAIDIISPKAWLNNIFMGHEEDYPACCVMEFANEAPFPSGLIKGTVDGEYVPCQRCITDGNSDETEQWK